MSISTRPSSRCVGCAETDIANAYDARPSQLMPIPNMALAGFPEGRSPHALTRRRLLQFGAAGIASVYAPQMLGWESVWESAVAQAAVSSTQKAIVVIFLAGGNDLLNTVVPTSTSDYPVYVRARPTLHRGQGRTAGGVVGSQIIPTSGGELAFANPLVSRAGGGDNGDPRQGFDVIYGDGTGGPGSNLALLPGVDYMPPSLSHFVSSDYWFAGDLDALNTGWLGRYLDVYGSTANPLQGISIGPTINEALRSASAPVSAIDTLPDRGFALPCGPGGLKSVIDADQVMTSLGSIAASPGNAELAYTRQAYKLGTQAHTDLNSLGQPVFGSGYAPGNLGPQLELAAVLLGAKLGTRVITINWGSFDTHGSQIDEQDRQLSELSISLNAFLNDLGARGVGDNVTTLLFSEFGRRVVENGGQGTDHGAGGLLMLAGNSVKGGFAAPFPGLKSLDPLGDLQVPTDFRSVYSAVIRDWLGGDPTQILPKAPFPAFTRYNGKSGLFN